MRDLSKTKAASGLATGAAFSVFDLSSDLLRRPLSNKGERI
jgi:hypothetical protein